MSVVQNNLVEEPSQISQLRTMLSIAIITWNLHGTLPPQPQLRKLLLKVNTQDIIFFLTQECQHSLFYSFFFQGKTNWQNNLRNNMSNTHQLIWTSVMQGLHTAVLIKKNMIKYAKYFNSLKYKAGFLGLFGNKGAISVQLRINGIKFQVINCHLAPHQNANEQRNQVLLGILENVIDKKGGEVFIAGDLNYRIQMNQNQYKQLIKDKDNTDQNINYRSKITKDQLYLQSILQKKFLSEFQEAPIQFPPTYKISLQSNLYCPNRIPGWTDRIFYRKKFGKQKYYNSEYHILGSDHRPVLGKYEFQIENYIKEQLTIPNVSHRCNLI